MVTILNKLKGKGSMNSQDNFDVSDLVKYRTLQLYRVSPCFDILNAWKQGISSFSPGL